MSFGFCAATASVAFSYAEHARALRSRIGAREQPGDGVDVALLARRRRSGRLPLVDRGLAGGNRLAAPQAGERVAPVASARCPSRRSRTTGSVLSTPSKPARASGNQNECSSRDGVIERRLHRRRARRLEADGADVGHRRHVVLRVILGLRQRRAGAARSMHRGRQYRQSFHVQTPSVSRELSAVQLPASRRRESPADASGRDRPAASRRTRSPTTPPTPAGSQ